MKYHESSKSKALWVIKIGGSMMDQPTILESLSDQFFYLRQKGIFIIIVHGGGKDIDTALSQYHVIPQFMSGLRVSDEMTTKIAEMVLSGMVNKRIVSSLLNNGLPAVGISGKDGSLLLCEKMLLEGHDIGQVGRIISVNVSLVNLLIQNHWIPVISPIGTSSHGETFNVNADTAASAIAAALAANQLIYLTDVDGLYGDIKNPETKLSTINIDHISEMIENGTIQEGMIPKVLNCAQSIKEGVSFVRIVNGTIPGNLIRIYEKDEIGTTFLNHMSL